MGNKQPTDEQKSQQNMTRQVDFKMHIAIDFGTDGCALAFAYDKKVMVYNKWKAKKRQRASKIKTQILLNNKDEIVAFGDNAKEIYSNLAGAEKETWKFFDRFKMSLYGDEYNKMTTINDLTCDADIIFVSTFKYIQEIATEYLTKINQFDISDDEIQWIITVPAIWSEKAKSKMKSWIIGAGLVNINILDQCLIVYEPDCAALCIQEEMQQNLQSKTIETGDNGFKKGDKYIILDAGGGTVDVACHEVMDANSAQEIHYPSGGDWGGCRIDDRYIILLQSIFGKTLMNKFKKSSPNTYTEIIRNFEDAKLTFYQDESAKVHPIELPYEFMQYLHEECNVNKKLSQFDIHNFKNHEEKTQNDDNDEIKDNIMSIAMDEDCIILDIGIWKLLFDFVINHIVKHVGKLLTNDLKDKCKYLYLVGGLSCSKYFQQRMKETFECSSFDGMKIIIPDYPMLSVIKGAAYFGFKKEYIGARKLRYTYGIKVTHPLEIAKQKGMPDSVIKRNRWCDGNREYVLNCFKILAQKGEGIPQDCIKSIETTQDGQSKTKIGILQSDKLYPMTVSDGYRIANVQLPRFKSDNEFKKIIIIIEFHFYGTMWTIRAFQKGHPNNNQIVKIEYK